MDLYALIGYLLLSKLTWLIVAALAALYYYLTLQHDYFEKNDIKFIKPVPLFGNMLPTVLRQKSFAEVFSDFYSKYPNEK